MYECSICEFALATRTCHHRLICEHSAGKLWVYSVRVERLDGKRFLEAAIFVVVCRGLPVKTLLELSSNDSREEADEDGHYEAFLVMSDFGQVGQTAQVLEQHEAPSLISSVEYIVQDCYAKRKALLGFDGSK